MTLHNRIHQAFDFVKADDKQKQLLKDYLAQQRCAASHKRFPVFMRAAVVLSALLLCIAAAGLYLVRTTAYTVHIDTSPAVALDLNQFDKVISVTTSAAEEASALEGLSVEGLSCPEAVEVLLDTEELQASLMENPEPAVTVEGQTEKQADRICSGIRRQVRARCQNSRTASATENQSNAVQPTGTPTPSAPQGTPQRKQLRKHGRS